MSFLFTNSAFVCAEVVHLGEEKKKVAENVVS